MIGITRAGDEDGKNKLIYQMQVQDYDKFSDPPKKIRPVLPLSTHSGGQLAGKIKQIDRIFAHFKQLKLRFL